MIETTESATSFTLDLRAYDAVIAVVTQGMSITLAYLMNRYGIGDLLRFETKHRLGETDRCDSLRGCWRIVGLINRCGVANRNMAKGNVG